MHMSYAEELKYKRSRVSNALLRIGGVDISPPAALPSPDTSRYRNKAIFAVGFEAGKPVTGFYRRRSHEIVAVFDGRIQTHTANLAAKTLRDWMSKSGVRNGLIRYLFCRTASDGGAAFAGLSKCEQAVALYCGAGTITLTLAQSAGFVYGIESVAEAVLNAKENAALNGAENVEFILGDAYKIRPAVVVVDPPRKGLSPGAIDAIAKMSPQQHQ